MSDNINSISIVSRASSLATIQAKMVGDRIKEILPDILVRYHTTIHHESKNKTGTGQFREN